MLATLTHICIIATPFARTHTHTPPLAALLRGVKRKWRVLAKREGIIHICSTYGCVVDGKDVPYQFTQHMQIRLKQEKEVKNKQQTTFEGGSGHTHTHRHTLTKKWLQRVPRFAPCLLPCALFVVLLPSAASLCNTSRAWHPSASILRPHLSASLHEP